MSKIKYLLLAIVVVAIGCAPSEEVLARRGEADYTIILYGCAGGNLDDELDEKINQLFHGDYEDDVHVTALVKYSASRQHKNRFAGTRRYSRINRVRCDNEWYADSSFEMDNPENFSRFVAETKERMPAKRYILILWNHGEEFSIFDQPYTPASRAIIYDDNRSYASLSIFELEEALLRTDTRFDAIILDACRMASAEYLFQIHNLTDFVVAPSHNIYGGMHYDKIVRSLADNSSLATSLTQFAIHTMKKWKRYSTTEAMDISVFDMAHSQPFLESLSHCSEQLLALRNSLSGDDLSRYNRLNKTTQKICSDFYGEEGILYFINPMADCSVESVDLLHHLSSFAEAFDHAPLKEAVGNARREFDKMCILNYTYNLPAKVGSTSLAVKWSYSHLYNRDYTREYIERVGQEPQFSTLKSLYPLLRFDQATSWHLLLEGNMLE